MARVGTSSRSAAPARPKLFAAGGFALFDAVPGDPEICRAMLHEAIGIAAQAVRQEHASDEAEDRGGLPARRLFSSPGGAVQNVWYASPELRDFVSTVVGAPLWPSGPQGSYSYYWRPGDHLGLHRDIAECDVAVISCLCDAGGSDGSGALRLYPTRTAESLARIRATPGDGAIALNLRPGQSIVLLGGYVPHATAPMGAGQKRLISALCFQGDWAATPH
jgi:hypothetical protein